MTTLDATSIPTHRPLRPSLRFGLTFADRRRVFLVAMAVPAVIYVIAIGVWPILQGFWFSLYDYNLLKPARTRFVGFGNYADLLVDPVMLRAMLNTFVFTVASVTIETLLGFGLALALWRDDLFNRIALAFVLVPVTITPLVVGLIFKALLLADYGPVGYWLAEWGISGNRGLFAYTHTALATLVFVDIWEWTPLVALILLAGLRALPGDILEAAQVDGATGWQRLKIVVIPLMLPSIFLALTLRTIDAFRVFDSVYVTTGGGPADATNTLMIHALKQGLEFFNIGTASAIANIALLCIALMATAFALLIRRADRKANGR